MTDRAGRGTDPSSSNQVPTQGEIAALPRLAQQILAFRAVARVRQIPDWRERHGADARVASDHALRSCADGRSSDAWASAAVATALRIWRRHERADGGGSGTFEAALDAVRQDLDSLRSLEEHARALDERLAGE